MPKNKIISAFAFNTARIIENIIKDRTNNLQEQNQMLEAKILQWYVKTRDRKFAKHFGIISTR